MEVSPQFISGIAKDFTILSEITIHLEKDLSIGIQTINFDNRLDRVLTAKIVFESDFMGFEQDDLDTIQLDLERRFKKNCSFSLGIDPQYKKNITLQIWFK